MPKARWNLLYKSNCPIGMIRPNRKRKQLIIKCLAKILTLAVVLQVLYVSPGKLWHLTSYAFPYQLPTQERALKLGSRFRTLENPWRQKVDPVIAASRSASGGENICWGRTNEQPYIGKIKIYVGNQKNMEKTYGNTKNMLTKLLPGFAGQVCVPLLVHQLSCCNSMIAWTLTLTDLKLLLQKQ